MTEARTVTRLAARQKAITGATVFLVAAAGLLFVATAASAPAAPAYGKWDLEILRRWEETGILAPLAELPDHLLKPGYILYLRAVLGTHPPFPIRRLLVANALLAAGAFAGVVLALRKSGRPRSALLAAAFFLLFSPLRDGVDDVLSEVSAAAGLLACIALLIAALPRGRRALLGAAGALAGLLWLVRPNVGGAAVLVGAVAVFMAGREGRARGEALLVGSFLAATGLATAAGAAKGLPLDPFSVEASTPLLWGAADYYWKPDVGPWPSATTSREKSRAERRTAMRIWRTKLRRWSADDRRALLWKLGHALLSSEQLPPRWHPPAYMAYDKALRRWWWLAALMLLSASAAAAAGGSGPWRLVPILIAAAIVVQGLLFGADPRFALPLVPAWLIVLLLALPGIPRSPRSVGAAAVALASGLALVAAVPDVSTSDYAVVRGPDSLSFSIPARAFVRTGERATLHVRFLELSQKLDRGLAIEAGGREIARYAADPRRPYPAFVSAVVEGTVLETARRAGLVVNLRPEGAPDWNFFYFPVIARPWAAPATIGGRATIESGYGGTTRGGIPCWVHDGIDPAFSPPVEAPAADSRSR